MGNTDARHAGIDLDTICINELMAESGASAGGELRSDPENYKVFVNDIFKKMKGQESFLSFTRQINNVNQILNMAYSSAGDIARVILKDLALTAQVLKLVNSSFYRQFSKKGISTISEAMIILGTDEVRQVAAGLKVYEMMKEMANSEVLREKTLKGLQRSIMARQIILERGNKGSDALQITAMVYELGEYLVALFDPTTYIRVEIAMEEDGGSRDMAAKKILGLTYSDLGRVVAMKLNLPEEVVRAMRPVTVIAGRPDAMGPGEETRYLCAFIKELCDIPATGEDAFDAAGMVADKYRSLLGFDMRSAVSLVQVSREKMVRHAELLEIEPVTEKKGGTGVKNKKGLEQGITLVEDALSKHLSIHEIFTRLVDTMDKSFYFNQVVISIKKKETNTMEPRFIRGEKRPREMIRSLAFKIDPTPDTFNNAIGRKTDYIVRDVAKEAYKQQVPQWYLKDVATPSGIQGFGVFPVFVDNKILAMIYVDWDRTAQPPDKETVDYIRIFREKMVKTFTLHSS